MRGLLPHRPPKRKLCVKALLICLHEHRPATILAIGQDGFRSSGKGNGMDEKSASGSGSAKDRKARLAQELRANLQKRKAQSRSRRTGEADARPDGPGRPTREGTQRER
jgi:hypothetical protein